MAEFCGKCCKKMKAPPDWWKNGDHEYLLKELKPDETATVLCENYGWITYKKTKKSFMSYKLEIIEVVPYQFK